MGFTKGKIKITTLGTQSDNLVKALGELFQIPTTDGFTKEVVLPNVFSSNKVNVDLSKKTAYSFKLFLENKKAEPAELFLMWIPINTRLNFPKKIHHSVLDLYRL
ncbi:hypothetical protein KUH03_38590 [Sphingobacterium sp. E70]|uniref:hypothetical protein n=1 Tax=Sphingobacterium sp. E70 TaxID=2853439 RepID=UPI00211CD376|nr:hypothetical protein [Sphingobacterium sp. E70]ULT24753.1 hypothetical protein KUH03_38590 [Sphingobacterium sp. E70]